MFRTGIGFIFGLVLLGAAGSSAAQQPLAEGTLTYRGTWDVQQMNPGPRRNSPPQLQQANGALTIHATFDGDQVSGYYSGDYPLQDVTFSGTRQGERCRLTISPRPATYDGVCSPTLFMGLSTSAPGDEAPYRLNIRAQASPQTLVSSGSSNAGVSNASRPAGIAASEAQIALLTDALTRNARYHYAPGSLHDVTVENFQGYDWLKGAYRNQVGFPEGVEARVENGRVICIQQSSITCLEIEWRRALPTTAAARRLQPQLVEALRQDAKSWRQNVLDAGSGHNFTPYESESPGYQVLRLDYTYNGGMDGWVEGRVEGGQITQIRYHDAQYWATIRTDAMRADVRLAEAAANAESQARADADRERRRREARYAQCMSGNGGCSDIDFEIGW